MADNANLRVEPEAMQVASKALESAANDLRSRLLELDREVRDMLSGWKGGAGGAYGDAWDLWHKGAGEVQQGLAILARIVENAGVKFQSQDTAAHHEVDGIYRG